MGLAELVDAPVLLAADIDRGGVFAQIYGTVMLLPEHERRRIKGIIINKFRGDVSLLEPGIRQIEELCHIPVVGVMPYLHLDIDDEDSLSERLTRSGGDGPVKIAVVRLPHMSNYTDFAPLEAEEMVSLIYAQKPEKLRGADVIILPGSKNTGADLEWVKRCGFDTVLRRLAGEGTRILGICGGYQMLGRTLILENGEQADGIGLLPVRTEFGDSKVTRQVRGRFLVPEAGSAYAGIGEAALSGYEIHMGRTQLTDGGEWENISSSVDVDADSVGTCPQRAGADTGRTRPQKAGAYPGGMSPQRVGADTPAAFARLTAADGTTVTDGCILNNAAGTYIHGLFDEDSFREGFLRMLCEEKGLAYDAGGNGHTDRHAYREAQYDALADAVEQYMDLNRILEIMNTSTGIDANSSTDIETTAANIETNTAKHVAANMDTNIVANRERNSAANSAKNSEMNSEK